MNWRVKSYYLTFPLPMATLTETAYYTRRTINFSLIGITALIVFKLLSGYLFDIWNGIFPPKPPPPKVCFGKLPAIKFPENSTKTGLTYSLETVDSSLPKMPTIASVYFMPSPTTSFGAHDQMKESALRLGFDSEPTRQSDTTKWKFVDSKNALRTLDYDETTGFFLLKYNYLLDQTVLFDKDLPSKEGAISEAKNFLDSQQMLTDDLKNGAGEVVFLKFNLNTLSPVGSLSEADFIRINLRRADIEKLPVVSLSKDRSPASFLISGSKESAKRFLEVAYNYRPYSSKVSCTYPLKPVALAFEELKQGKAFVSISKSGVSSVAVTKIYLGYYDSLDIQTYLMPVFVFEGDNFVAYVPAVDSRYSE